MVSCRFSLPIHWRQELILKDGGQRLHAASRCVSSISVALIFQPWRSAKWDINRHLKRSPEWHQFLAGHIIIFWYKHNIIISSYHHHIIMQSFCGWVFYSPDSRGMIRMIPWELWRRQRKEANRCSASPCFALNKWIRSIWDSSTQLYTFICTHMISISIIYT